MSFIDGAAFSTTYPTSYGGLVYRANLQPNETLLVHAAAGGVGTAAVQIGRALGAKVIATVGSTEKVEIAKKAGAHHVIDLSKQDLVASVKALTDGKGADVIYDPVGGEVFDKSTSCIAWNGRIVVVGFASGTIPSVKTNRVLLKNMSIVGLAWGAHALHEPDKMVQAMDALLAMYARGQLRPLIYPKIFKLRELPEALKLLGSRKSYGKIVISNENDGSLQAKL